MSVTIADWYADPTGRHALRYWDGAAWTEHVSDDGAVAAEPVAWPAALPTAGLGLGSSYLWFDATDWGRWPVLDSAGALVGWCLSNHGFLSSVGAKRLLLGPDQQPVAEAAQKMTSCSVRHGTAEVARITSLSAITIGGSTRLTVQKDGGGVRQVRDPAGTPIATLRAVERPGRDRPDWELVRHVGLPWAHDLAVLLLPAAIQLYRDQVELNSRPSY